MDFHRLSGWGFHPRLTTPCHLAITNPMTESTWQRCEDPNLLLYEADKALPKQLRRLACLCCQRIFKEHPHLFYGSRVSSEEYEYPAFWEPETLLAAVAAAESCGGGAPAPEHAEGVSEIVESGHTRWQWANYRLGDTASLWDYEIAFTIWKSAEAVAACCATDIRGSISHCLESAAAAMDFQMEDEAKQIAAVAKERRVQAEIVRSLIEYPPRFGMKMFWSGLAAGFVGRLTRLFRSG